MVEKMPTTYMVSIKFLYDTKEYEVIFYFLSYMSGVSRGVGFPFSFLLDRRVSCTPLPTTKLNNIINKDKNATNYN